MAPGPPRTAGTEEYILVVGTWVHLLWGKKEGLENCHCGINNC